MSFFGAPGGSTPAGLVPMSETIAFLALLAALAVAFASMGVYAWRGRQRDTDVVGKGGQFLLGLGDFPMHWLMWVISPLVRASQSLGLTADFYSYLSLVLGLATGPLIAIGDLELGGWLIVLSGIADALDGRMARLTGTASKFGDFIDSTFDRFVEASTFLGFAFYLRGTPWGPLIAATALAGALIVSYARARGEVLGVVCTGGLMQRGERVVLTAAASFLDPPLTSGLGIPPGSLVLWTMALIAATTFLTAAYRTVWIARRLH
jgi:CDP-diacylglycerol--glycerol-3-phosphate 3-phosphatidyltransferase